MTKRKATPTVDQVWESRDHQYEPGRRIRITVIHADRADFVNIANPSRPARVGAEGVLRLTTLHSRWRLVDDGSAGDSAPAESTDLLARLQASVDRARASRQEGVMGDGLGQIPSTPQISTDGVGVHRDEQGREYVAVDVDGEVDFEPFSIEARAQGIRDAAAYINRMGRLMGSHEQRHKMAGVPEFLTELADAVLEGVVKL